MSFLSPTDRFEILRRIECVCLELCSQSMRHSTTELEETTTTTTTTTTTNDIYKISIQHPLTLKIRTITNTKSTRSNISLCHILRVASKIYEAVLKKNTATLRALYYQNRDLFIHQTASNLTLSLCSQLLRVRRPLLSIFATGRGVVWGPLHIYDNNKTLIGNCNTNRSPHGLRIADGLAFARGLQFESLGTVQEKPQFILVVEKESAFNAIVEEIVRQKRKGAAVIPFVMLSGNGMPSLATREFLRVMKTNLQIPALGLFDCNPDGIGVMLSYLYTSNASINSLGWVAQRSDYTITEMYWLGVTTHMVELEAQFRGLRMKDAWKIASGTHSQRDLTRFRTLSMHPKIKSNSKMQKELETQQSKNLKFEIDQLSYCGSIYNLIEQSAKHEHWIKLE